MEINDTVIKNIRKQVEAYREEIADREEKIKVLMNLLILKRIISLPLSPSNMQEDIFWLKIPRKTQ